MRFSVHEMSLAVRITRGKSEATTILTLGVIDAVKLLVAQAHQDPALHHLHGRLDLSFLIGPELPAVRPLERA